MRISRNFLDHLPIFSLLANVADVKSLVMEKAEDLIAALDAGFEAI